MRMQSSVFLVLLIIVSVLLPAQRGLNAPDVIAAGVAAEDVWLAALSRGEIVEIVDDVYERRDSPNPASSSFDLPESYTNRLWLRYADTGQASLFCNVVTAGTQTLQDTYYDFATEEFVSTDHKTGAIDRVTSGGMSLAELRASLKKGVDLAASASATGETRTSDLSLNRLATVVIVDAGPASSVPGASANARVEKRLYFDAVSHEQFAGETWLKDEKAPLTLLRRRVRTVSVSDGDVPCATGTASSGPSPDSPAATCCSLQLDMDPATPGVQPSVTVTGQPDISIDVVLGDDAGELGAFDFKLVYDDTRLAPVAGGGGLNGNPDFNEAALGTGWACGSSPSGEPDIDPETGPGHGVAFISCYVTGQPPTLGTPAAVATLRLRFLAAGDASIDIAEANFAHYDATDIGSCNPVNNVEMACAGGSVSGS